MKKSIFVLIMLCCCLLFMVACASDEGTETPADTDTETPADTETPEELPTYELQMSIQDGPENPVVKSAQRAVERIYEDSDGRINITLYMNGVLGDYITMYEDLQRSVIDIAQLSYADQFHPAYNIMTLPYAVQSHDTAKVLWDPKDGDFFKIYKDAATETGIDLIAPSMAGFQGVSGNNLGNLDTILDPTIKQGDGALIRVPMMESYVALGEAMGFSITTIAFGDVYSSLQTGVCTGVIGTPAVSAWDLFKDVINIWVEFKYGCENAWITARPDLEEDMGEDYQIIWDAFYDEFFIGADASKTDGDEAMQKLADYGCNVIVPTQEELAPMQNHVIEVVWPQFAEMFADLGGQDFLDELLVMVQNASE